MADRTSNHARVPVPMFAQNTYSKLQVMAHEGQENLR